MVLRVYFVCVCGGVFFKKNLNLSGICTPAGADRTAGFLGLPSRIPEAVAGGETNTFGPHLVIVEPVLFGYPGLYDTDLVNF